jgi:hypothetical protein
MPFSKEERFAVDWMTRSPAGTVPAVARGSSQGPYADLSIIKYVPHYIRHTQNKLEHVFICVSGVMQAPGVSMPHRRQSDRPSRVLSRI